MPSLAQLHHQLHIAKDIVHIAHTGKHLVSGKEDMLLHDMYKSKPRLVREAEDRVVAIEKAILKKETAPRKTRKAKSGGRTRRRRM
jgi:hypothetical protein